MSSESDLADLRDQVLRKIGRNVVNFQKMEGMLKFLAAHQWPEFETLKTIVNALGQLRSEVARYVASDEFLADARQTIDGPCES